MKRFLIFLLIILAMGGGVWIYQSGMVTTNRHSESKDIYYCPMHPFYTSNKPGKCPICQMKLVKREEDVHEEASGAQGKITPKEFTVEELMKMKPGEICLLHKCKMGKCLIAITPEIARLGKCPHCGEDLGVIVKNAFPKGYTDIKMTPGKETLIGVKTEPVKKMNLTKTIRTLGRIAYDPDLYRAEEEFVQSIQAFQKTETSSIPEIKEQAAHLAESSKLKLKLLGLNDDLIKELEVSGKADRSLLYSEAGDHVWLYAPIYEYEIPVVKVGQRVMVGIPSMPDKKMEGTIRAIDSVLDSMTRSVKIRAVLDNPAGLLKPEMYVNATLQVDLGDVLQVPKEAIFKTGEKNIVFVKKENGAFEPREVLLGIESGEYEEVKGGLFESEGVVTSGNFLIDSESRLKAALKEVPAGGHQHGAS